MRRACYWSYLLQTNFAITSTVETARKLLKRLKPILDEKFIPTHQFGFRNNHSTIDQVHRITNLIEKTLEEKQVCSSTFLDVAQAVDVWHEGLYHKIELLLPPEFSQLLQSYLSVR
jgi:hypothetical protein